MFTDWDFRICLLAFGCLFSLASAGVFQNRGHPQGPLTSDEFKKALTAFAHDVDDDSDSEESPGLFEGDIILPTAAEGESREMTNDDGRKWKKSLDGLVRVPYEIPDHFTEKQRLAIARTVMEYAAKTCIRLVPHVESDIYPDPHISFSDEHNRYASPLGCEPYTVNRIDIMYNNVKWGKVAHEVMHTLGFFHEHTRLDRDQYLRMNWNSIGSNKEQYKKCKWVAALHAGCREATTEYDYASIMHYKTQQTGFDGIKREVFTPLREVPAGVKIGQRVELSPGDVKGIRDFYQCADGSHDSTIELPEVTVLDCPANNADYDASGQCERYGIAMGLCSQGWLAKKCPTTCCEDYKALGL